jgi:hypothetical protein
MKASKVKGTHQLLSARGARIQDSEMKPARERHSPTVERRRDSSGQGKPAPEGHSLSVEGVVRTIKESQRARDTHVLSSAEGVSYQVPK